jgi:hypothetical protein
MPAFIKTPKDEARWERAKKAARKRFATESERFWKLTNYIYQRMKK